jgi:hypothetical protein
MTLHYLETARFDGAWMPQVTDGPPRIVTSGGRKRLGSGTGPRIRFDPKPIDPGHAHLTLDQLQQVYGPDGQFTAGQENQGGANV